MQRVFTSFLFSTLSIATLGCLIPLTVKAQVIGIDNSKSLIFPDSVARGNILFTNSSRIIVAGGGNGAISLDANNLELNSGSTLLAGIAFDPGEENAQAGDIAIAATENALVNGADSDSGLISNTVFGQGIR